MTRGYFINLIFMWLIMLSIFLMILTDILIPLYTPLIIFAVMSIIGVGWTKYPDKPFFKWFNKPLKKQH